MIHRPFIAASPAALALCLVMLAGCSSYKSTGGNPGDELIQREREAAAAVDRFRQTDPTMQRFFETAAGYAVFPRVTKGGAGIGAAHGRGVVYENGQVIGYASMTQGTLGFQLGGQSYSQIIFFQDAATFDTFKQSNLEFAAQASAVAAAHGASADADFAYGVAVFTLARGGLMFEASIGGQKFAYTPR
jgi:lipid-binding SYLF domain-containing protein